MTLSVTTLSQSFVKPSDPTPTETLKLSAIDRVPGLRHMVRSLHVFKHGQNPCEVIREALAKALVQYYPFTGRFVELEGGEVAIDCNVEGAWFVEAMASCSLEDVKYMDYPLVMSKEELLPQASPEFDPLDVPVMLKVTEFTCGGFVVGLISIHTIADGLGAAQFIRAIGDLARGPKPAVNPILSRELIPTPPQLPPSPPPVFPLFKLVSFVTDIHPDYISKIKASYFETTGEHCSAFDISTAKAWQARTRAACCVNDSVSISLVYRKMNQQAPPTVLSETIWGGWHYPKHSFILWLASLSRLLTQNRLCRMSILSTSQCVLCSNQMETCEHLYFECQYSATVWNKIMDWLGYRWRTCKWNQLTAWYGIKGFGFKKKLKRMALSAAVYLIWQERNLRLFQHKARDPDKLFRVVKITIYAKILNDNIPNHVREYIECL